MGEVSGFRGVKLLFYILTLAAAVGTVERFSEDRDIILLDKVLDRDVLRKGVVEVRVLPLHSSNDACCGDIQ